VKEAGVKEQTISFEGNLWIEVVPNHEHDPSAPNVGVAHVDSAEFGGDGVKLYLRYEEVPSDASRKPKRKPAPTKPAAKRATAAKGKK
jgi:hypothetical protein